jgi:hypothetical protein
MSPVVAVIVVPSTFHVNVQPCPGHRRTKRQDPFEVGVARDVEGWPIGVTVIVDEPVREQPALSVTVSVHSP